MEGRGVFKDDGPWRRIVDRHSGGKITLHAYQLIEHRINWPDRSAYQARQSGRPASGQTPGWPTATLTATIHSDPSVWYDRFAKREVFFV